MDDDDQESEVDWRFCKKAATELASVAI
jgi:hypothetical protein